MLLDLKKWWCTWVGHSPTIELTEIRRARAVGIEYEEHYEEAHDERYSTCSRCNEEIRYIRFFDTWRKKEDIVGKGFGRFITKEEADRA